MGLDMYLFSRTNCDVDWVNDEALNEVGYWRKFSALHAYILNYKGEDLDFNCRYLELDGADLRHLRDHLKKIKSILDCYWIDEGEPYLELTADAYEEISELMPPQPGFFWGSLSISEDYSFAVDHSIEVFEEAIRLNDAGAAIAYSCWW